jgi:hypothetical protein
VDNRQRNHHYPQLSAKEEIKSPAIVVKASCNTLLTSLKRCLFNKEITVIQAQFSGGLWEYARPFSAATRHDGQNGRYAPELAPGKCRAGWPAETSSADSSLFHRAFPRRANGSAEKSMMDDVTKNTPVRRQGCDTHP